MNRLSIEHQSIVQDKVTCSCGREWMLIPIESESSNTGNDYSKDATCTTKHDCCWAKVLTIMGYLIFVTFVITIIACLVIYKP